MKNKWFYLSFVLLALTIVPRASADPEWIDTDGDGQADTLLMDPFIVNGNDPETYDWDGLLAALDSIGITVDPGDSEDTVDDNAQVGSGSPNGTGSDIVKAPSQNNGWGLTNKYANYQVPRGVIGKAFTNGQGGWEVRTFPNSLPSRLTSDAKTLDVIKDSITRHENSHVTDALAAAPTLGDNMPAGLTLISNPATTDATEAKAYQVEIDFLRSVISAGSYQGTTLDQSQIDNLTYYLGNREAVLKTQGWK